MQVSHIPSASKITQLFKPAKVVHPNVKWGYIERTFKFNDIPTYLKHLGDTITSDVQRLLGKYHLPQTLEPEIILNVPDNMPYRGFTPIRSIESRLKDAQSRIKNTLYDVENGVHHDNETSKTKHFTEFLKDKLNLTLPKNYVEKLSNPNKAERDEALREYLFENPKTASAIFNLPYKRVTIDVARLHALQAEIEANPQIKKFYPHLEDKFSEMLSAQILLKYMDLIGTNTSLLNKDLFKDSFKFGVKFFVPPTPGIFDTTAIALATSQNYVRGIKKFLKTVEKVNSPEFLATINPKLAYTTLPKRAEAVLSNIAAKLHSTDAQELKNKDILLAYHEKFSNDFLKGKTFESFA